MRRRWLNYAIVAVVMACFAMHADAADFDSGGTPFGWRTLDTAMRDSYHGHYSDAIAAAGKAIAATPDFAEAYVVRAGLEMTAGRYAEAVADLDHASAMHPEAVVLVFMRAEIAVRQRDAGAALADLARASAMPERTLWHRRYASFNIYTAARLYALQSIALELRHDDTGALAGFDNMLKFETVFPWHILGFHCYEAAVAGLAEMAELSCNEAIRLQGQDRGAYDSRGLAHLKMQAWAKAVADYDAALVARPDLTLSLYGRGLAKLHLGDTAGGNADIAAAKQGDPDIANIMTRLGVKA